EPAHRSRNRAPSIRGARILNSVSRNRSEVGRVSNEGGLFSFRPRYLPAMIRTNESADYADYNETRRRTQHHHFIHLYFNLWNPCNLRTDQPTAASFMRASLWTRLIILAASGDVLLSLTKTSASLRAACRISKSRTKF